MKRSALAAAAFCTLAATHSAAADYDGSRLLMCANMEAGYCSSGQACVSGRSEDIGAPTFFRIDFANNSIVGPARTTPIASVEKSGEQLLLQGTELDYAWNLALDTVRGNLAATIIDREGIVVLFGGCTPL